MTGAALSILDILLILLASLAAGAINALAGGGTLITFPTLVAIGIPPIMANVTSTVALCPGYFGATWAQIETIKQQKQRLFFIIPIALLGGFTGAWLLTQTQEATFQSLVPFLILGASLLLAIQQPFSQWLKQRLNQKQIAIHTRPAFWVLPLLGLAAIYGGYFGAGLSVVVLASLALAIDDSLTRLNALKQAVAFFVNIAAATFFLFSDEVIWMAAGVMAVGAFAGGMLGGKLSDKIPANTLRLIVVCLGMLIALTYWLV